jgi:hypothetical protein
LGDNVSMSSVTRWRAACLVVVALEVAALTPLWSADAARGGTPARRGPVDRITVTGLRGHLTFIASDALEGRGAVTPGFRVAAEYLAAQLARAGVEPAGDAGTFLQRVPLLRRVVDPATTSLTFGDTSFGTDDVIARADGAASGPLAFVGHGYRIASRQIDPFAGLDVRGRILVVVPGLPPGVTRAELNGMEEGAEWTGPEANAARYGAVGIVRVAGARARARWSARAARRGRSLTLDERDPSLPSLPSATISPRVLAALLEGEPHGPSRIEEMADGGAAVRSFALSNDKRPSLSVGSQIEELESWNVIGIVRGADPVLADEYVALGAHLDHMGRTDAGDDNGSSTDDAIYNGADDDGSGVVALLAMAEAAVAAPRPRRSLLFVWHTAEEDGSLGAQYFLQRPVVPIDRIVAQLNLDMVGRSRPPLDRNPDNAALTGPREVYVVGSRRLSSALGDLCQRVNREYLRLSFNYRHDDPDDPERIYERSDHYEYAQKGIPVAFYFSGLHQDYHRPSDEVAAIDFDKLQAVARTVLATAWALADAPERPALDGQ